MSPISVKAKCLFVAISVCWVVVARGWSQVACTSPDEKTTEAHHQWLSEALTLIGKLQDVARRTPDVIMRDSGAIAALAAHSMTLRDSFEKGDELIWRLWLITGLPPKIDDPEESLRAFLEESAAAYQEYVAKHSRLTEAELNRLGLSNAVKSIGSPLWYASLEFLEQKVGVNFRQNIVLCVSPPRRVVHHALRRESQDRLSRALGEWLRGNEGMMLWDPRGRRFRPRDGGYIGTEELSKVVKDEFSIDMGIP